MSLGKKIRGGFAALLSASLVVSGALLVAPAASAVDVPTPAPATATAMVQVASETGLTVQVDVTGISPSPLPERVSGAYVGVVEAGSDVRIGSAAFISSETTSTGTAATSLQLDAATLDRSKSYEAVVWYAHGGLIPEAVFARAPITLSPDQWDLVFPPAVLEPGPGDSGVDGDLGESPAAAPSEVEVADLTPRISVSKVSGLNPEGDSITVSGVNFDVATKAASYYGNPDLLAGVYVQLGWVKGDAWSPSSGGKNKIDRLGVASQWVSNAVPASVRWTDATTGSFEVTFDGVTEAELTKDMPEGARLAVFTTVAGGAAAQAKYELIEYLEFADLTPRISVSKVSGLNPEGDSITVSGVNFDVATKAASYYGNPDLLAGVYVQLGWVKGDAWSPSSGGKNKIDRLGVASQWVSNAVPASVRWTDATTGSFEVTFDGVTEAELTKDMPEGARLAVFTTVAGGAAAQAKYELIREFTFADPIVDTVNASVSKITPGEGITVDVIASGLPVDIAFAYVGVFEKPAVAGSQLKMNAFTSVFDGSLLTSLEVPIAPLDRSKSYEVVIWKQHSVLNEENLYKRVDLKLAETQWDQLLGVGNQNGGGIDDGSQPSTPGAVSGSGPAVAPASQSAGSLTWGISSEFAEYTTNPARPAKGEIRTSGVGGGRGGWSFPQASAASWNAASQTGFVQYSGTVTFWGHQGAMVTTFTDPVITVNSATSGSISVSGRTYALDLGSASKSVGPNGEVTWGGVRVIGTLSGGSSAGVGGSFSVDPLTFTVGATSAVQYGSTRLVDPSKNRSAAAAPPSTQGIRVITQSNELVAGGEIEFEASGFQPGERGILVVMYSEPTVLDTNAGADANGVVRWIGTLPEDLTGEHTITLQGSINVGKVITIAAAEPVKKTAVNTAEVEDAQITEVQAAGVSDSDGPGWVIWASALALLVVAGGLTALVVAQRRRAGGGTL